MVTKILPQLFCPKCVDKSLQFKKANSFYLNDQTVQFHTHSADEMDKCPLSGELRSFPGDISANNCWQWISMD